MTPSQLIDQQIQGFPDWRGTVMKTLRKLITEADPDIIEEWKWETGVWRHHGMVCAVSAFKDHVKINFFKGAQLGDPDKLFNNGFTSKQHRSIDFFEGDLVNESGVKALISEAVALNNKK